MTIYTDGLRLESTDRPINEFIAANEAHDRQHVGAQFQPFLKGRCKCQIQKRCQRTDRNEYERTATMAFEGDGCAGRRPLGACYSCDDSPADSEVAAGAKFEFALSKPTLNSSNRSDFSRGGTGSAPINILTHSNGWQRLPYLNQSTQRIFY
ncbi:hypothetical protein [Bradyrhizobium neotropicale]|uniref:hypothetical protein n=1 Tax=Bradyrhizobium neotropicale TaxID=1497615 RepID=UPI0011AB4ED5|nr:hypothetical protein [Bradyrhizobium neotropicale]